MFTVKIGQVVTRPEKPGRTFITIGQDPVGNWWLQDAQTGEVTEANRSSNEYRIAGSHPSSLDLQGHVAEPAVDGSQLAQLDTGRIEQRYVKAGNQVVFGYVRGVWIATKHTRGWKILHAPSGQRLCEVPRIAEARTAITAAHNSGDILDGYQVDAGYRDRARSVFEAVQQQLAPVAA